MRLLAVAGLAFMLAGCASSSHQPEQALASSQWLGGDYARLRVTVGIYDDRWVSTPCECRILVEVDGKEVGAWDVTPEDFSDERNRTWRGEVPGALIEACPDHQPFNSLTATIQLSDRTLSATGFVGCKGH